ncbi:MAG TPA: glycine betaine ABC transporter substrate-binding protein [Rubrobacteraceae bacterium]|nr:glycine betaine ABC transporter substrate-binding protein [Rubrobacteraceae bacterium]
MVILPLVMATLVAGCAGGSLEKELTIGTTSWDESVAISNLTKALLEDELGYDSVELTTLDVASLFESVGSGDVDAFQAVRIPDHQEHLSPAQDEVELLDPWLQDTPRIGVAAPSYMNITSIPQLNQTGATEIVGIEPEAELSKRIPDEVIPTYHLEQEYGEWSAPAMLYEVGKRISNGEEFAFIAWSPHWMNQRYDFVYLDDPENALGELNEPSRMTTVVRKNLPYDDPVAYTLVEALALSEEQVGDLEEAINATGDPLLGARTWAENNHDVVKPWIEAAKQAR